MAAEEYEECIPKQLNCQMSTRFYPLRIISHYLVISAASDIESKDLSPIS